MGRAYSRHVISDGPGADVFRGVRTSRNIKFRALFSRVYTPAPGACYYWKMKKLYTPSDESELVFLKSMFEAEGIPFVVLNDHFGSLYSGVYVGRFNAKTIMVPDDAFEDARELILSVRDDAVFEDESRGENADGGPGILDTVLGALARIFGWQKKKGGG